MLTNSHLPLITLSPSPQVPVPVVHIAGYQNLPIIACSLLGISALCLVDVESGEIIGKLQCGATHEQSTQAQAAASSSPSKSKTGGGGSLQMAEGEGEAKTAVVGPPSIGPAPPAWLDLPATLGG